MMIVSIFNLNHHELACARAEHLADRDWNLPANARLRDVVIAVREDEAGHRDKNHAFADAILARRANGRAAKEVSRSTASTPPPTNRIFPRSRAVAAKTNPAATQRRWEE